MVRVIKLVILTAVAIVLVRINRKAWLDSAVHVVPDTDAAAPAGDEPAAPYASAS